MDDYQVTSIVRDVESRLDDRIRSLEIDLSNARDEYLDLLASLRYRIEALEAK